MWWSDVYQDHQPTQNQNKPEEKVMNQNYIAMIEKWCFRDNEAHEIIPHNELRWEH